MKIKVHGTNNCAAVHIAADTPQSFRFPRKTPKTAIDSTMVAVLLALKYAICARSESTFIMTESKPVLNHIERGTGGKKGFIIKKMIELIHRRGHKVFFHSIPFQFNADAFKITNANAGSSWNEEFVKFDIQKVNFNNK